MADAGNGGGGREEYADEDDVEDPVGGGCSETVATEFLP